MLFARCVVLEYDATIRSTMAWRGSFHSLDPVENVLYGGRVFSDCMRVRVGFVTLLIFGTLRNFDMACRALFLPAVGASGAEMALCPHFHRKISALFFGRGRMIAAVFRLGALGVGVGVSIILRHGRITRMKKSVRARKARKCWISAKAAKMPI